MKIGVEKSRGIFRTDSMQKALWLSGALAGLGVALLAVALVGLIAF